MTDDARRALTEEERARLQAARHLGGACGRCGRALAADEPVWIEPVPVDPAGAIRWLAPLGGECASRAFLRETAGKAPEPCAACGRGVYWGSAGRRRLAATCSRRCAARWWKARRRERGS